MLTAEELQDRLLPFGSVREESPIWLDGVSCRYAKKTRKKKRGEAQKNERKKSMRVRMASRVYSYIPAIYIYLLYIPALYIYTH